MVSSLKGGCGKYETATINSRADLFQSLTCILSREWPRCDLSG